MAKVAKKPAPKQRKEKSNIPAPTPNSKNESLKNGKKKLDSNKKGKLGSKEKMGGC